MQLSSVSKKEIVDRHLTDTHFPFEKTRFTLNTHGFAEDAIGRAVRENTGENFPR